MAEYTVLAVDDLEENLRLLERVFQRHFADCLLVTAGSGGEALQLAGTFEFDAAILDVHMPEMDGIELCRRLKALPSARNTPILLVTGGSSSSDLRAEGLEAGADDFVTRPVRQAELRARVRVLLRVRRTESELRHLNAELEAQVDARTRALARERDRAQAYLETAQVILVALDPEGRVERINPKGCELIGAQSERIVGRTWVDEFVAPADRDAVRERLRDALRNGSAKGSEESVPEPTECVIVASSGEQRTIEWRTAVLRDRDGTVTGLIRSGEDVTDQRRLERLVLEAAEAEQRTIARDLHDDLGQKLAGTRFLAGMLGRRLPAGTEDQADAQRVTDLVDEILQDVRGLVRGLRPVGVESGSLLQALQELTSRVSRTRGIPCTLDIDGTVSVADDVAATHVYRIVQEAVTNAAKHAEPKAIHVLLGCGDEGLSLSIEDDGVGLPAASDGGASGVGLQVMACRAGMLGGTFSVEPNEGGGTVVRCVVPDASSYEGVQE